MTRERFRELVKRFHPDTGGSGKGHLLRKVIESWRRTQKLSREHFKRCIRCGVPISEHAVRCAPCYRITRYGKASALIPSEP